VSIVTDKKKENEKKIHIYCLPPPGNRKRTKRRVDGKRNPQRDFHEKERERERNRERVW